MGGDDGLLSFFGPGDVFGESPGGLLVGFTTVSPMGGDDGLFPFFEPGGVLGEPPGGLSVGGTIASPTGKGVGTLDVSDAGDFGDISFGDVAGDKVSSPMMQGAPS